MDSNFLEAALAELFPPVWRNVSGQGLAVAELWQGAYCVATLYWTHHPRIPYEVFRSSDFRSWRVRDEAEALLCVTGQLRP